jgi:hypothetical protein
MSENSQVQQGVELYKTNEGWHLEETGGSGPAVFGETDLDAKGQVKGAQPNNAGVGLKKFFFGEHGDNATTLMTIFVLTSLVLTIFVLTIFVLTIFVLTIFVLTIFVLTIFVLTIFVLTIFVLTIYCSNNFVISYKFYSKKLMLSKVPVMHTLAQFFV